MALQLTIACVGALHERFYRDACAEYAKRLTHSVHLTITEVKDVSAPQKLSAAQMQAVKEKEGTALLKALGNVDILIALCIDGKAMSSETLAGQLGEWMLAGQARIGFAIGGSLGLGDNVLTKAGHTLSLSKLTLPHALARIVLLEQLYRATTIWNHQPYHK